MANQCKHAALAVVFPSGVNKMFFVCVVLLRAKLKTSFCNYFYILECEPSGVPNGQWMKIPRPGKQRLIIEY